MDTTNTTTWKTLADIQPIRTREPNEMIGKYLAEHVIKKWNEDFVDAPTGEIVSIERNQMIFERGTYITDMKLQEIMFAIQGEEIKDVAVTDNKIDATRFISGGMYPFEVTISQQGTKRVYLVRATSPEAANICISNYAPIYLGLHGYYSIISVKHIACSIVDDSDIIITSSAESEIDTDIEYYKTLCRFRHYSDYEERMVNEDTTLILKAHDVGEAKARSNEWMNNLYYEQLGEKFPYNSIIILKAQPYTTSGIVPQEYCALFKEKETE